MNDFERKALREYGVDDEVINAVEIKAQRLEARAQAPDGAVVYIPMTTAYAMKDLVGKKTLRKLER